MHRDQAVPRHHDPIRLSALLAVPPAALLHHREIGEEDNGARRLAVEGLKCRLYVSERVLRPAEGRHASVPRQHDRAQLPEDLLLQHDEDQPGHRRRRAQPADGRYLHREQSVKILAVKRWDKSSSWSVNESIRGWTRWPYLVEFRGAQIGSFKSPYAACFRCLPLPTNLIQMIIINMKSVFLVMF